MNSKYHSTISGHALVLGGSGGIGKEIVLALAENGAQAISFTYGRNREVAEQLAHDLEAKGIKTYFASIDRLDEEGLKSFLETAVATTGEEVTMMVDTIGISPNQPHAEHRLNSDDRNNPGWRQIFETNVEGSFLALRLVAMRMKQREVKGSIALITSSNGVNSQAEYSVHYDSSKAAQAHMMRTLAEVYAKYGIRINAVAPGWVATSMNATLPPGETEKETSKIWSGRFAEPSEIATVVTFLLSSGASYIIGQNILVDGGYR